MRQSLHIGKEPNFQKFIVASALFHLIFITLITMPLRSKEHDFQSYTVSLVPTVKVQEKEEPAEVKVKSEVEEKKEKEKVETKVEKKIVEETKTELKPPPRKKLPPEKGVSLDPSEKISREIERLRAINALVKQKKHKEQEIVRTKEAEETVASAIEGIRKKKLIDVSKKAGIPGAGTSTGSDSYYALVTQKIWSEWIYPDFSLSGLEVIISIRINSEGLIVSQKIEKSSGNAMFDRSATNAISKASPLPAPPVEMEIGVRFYI